MRRLFLLFLFALPAPAQTIQNPSFESTPLAPGAWNTGPITSWTAQGFNGLWSPTGFNSIPDGKMVVWVQGSLSQDLGAAAQAGTYTLSASVGHRSDSPQDNGSSWVLSLYAGTTQLCSATGAIASIPVGTFALQSLPCVVPAPIPAGNLTVKLSVTGFEAVFDSVALNFVSAIVPQPLSITVKAQLLWCAACNQTDDVAAAGSLVIAQTNGPSGTYVIRTDGSISASGTIDIAQDPLEFTLYLIDSTGVAQPGAKTMLTFPRFELASPSFILGTFSLGVVRIAHTTIPLGSLLVDGTTCQIPGGCPAVRLASIDQFKLL